MKRLLKLSGSLILDQFVGIIAGSMLVLCVALLKNSLMAYVGAFIFAFSFYAYATYNSSFKCGFRDHHRIRKDATYKGYLYKGAISGFIAAIPLSSLYFVYLFTRSTNVFVVYMIADMYWTWPLKGIIPNHPLIVTTTSLIPMVIIPWLGYIAGYKNFLFQDLFVNLYKKYFAAKK